MQSSHIFAIIIYKYHSNHITLYSNNYNTIKMNKSIPTVSVIVPNYNYARFLDQRIASILNQTYTNYELILLDDASTDNSAEILKKYQDNPHISQIIINEHNSGSPFKQWMKGISLAKGEWIWIAEADDLCEPTFLETCMRYIEMDKGNTSICNVGSVYINSKGKNINRAVQTWEKNEKQVSAISFDGKKFAEFILYWSNKVPNASGVVFRKEYALRIQDPTWTTMRYCGDWLFWFEMVLQGNAIQVYKILNYFRIHNSQTSKGISSGQNIVESLKVALYIRKKIPSIGYDKSRQKYGREARIIRHLKDKAIQNKIKKEYQQMLHSSFLKNYLYYKLHRHLRFLPMISSEEKEKKKALKYSHILE